MKVSSKTIISEALNAHPAVAAVFKKYNLRCADCGGAANEPLEICARNYGFDPEELVAEINRAIEGGPGQNRK